MKNVDDNLMKFICCFGVLELHKKTTKWAKSHVII